MSTTAKVLLALLAIWVLLGVVGFIVKALFWLFVIALVGAGATVALSAQRRGMIGRRR